MLKLLRHKNVTKIVLWGLLILILPAFVLWGTGSGGGKKQTGPTFVGTIDNKIINFNDFAESLAAVRCQIILNYFNQPKVMDTFLSSKAFLGKLAWDRLLMAREAHKENIKVSNKEVIAFIRNHPLFLRNGTFDDKLYGYILRNNLGFEPRMFEEITRSNLEIQRLNTKITQNVTASDEEIVEAYGKDNNKFTISYLAFPVSKYLDNSKIDESRVREYFEEHKDEFISGVKINETAKPEEKIEPAFDDLKEKIKSYLAEEQAGALAAKDAADQYEKLKEIMAKESLSFAAACAKLDLKTEVSKPFSKSEYIEGVGEADKIAEEISKLKPGEVSNVVMTRSGAVIFIVTDIQKFDKEKFTKEIDDFSKRALDQKKVRYLEDWLRGLEQANKINIDFKDYEKYYR